MEMESGMHTCITYKSARQPDGVIWTHRLRNSTPHTPALQPFTHRGSIICACKGDRSGPQKADDCNTRSDQKAKFGCSVMLWGLAVSELAVTSQVGKTSACICQTCMCMLGSKNKNMDVTQAPTPSINPNTPCIKIKRPLSYIRVWTWLPS